MDKINQAMILAAGMGSRMKQLTQGIPKPMLLVDGISLIERHLNYFYQYNIHKIAINTFYKGQILKDFVKNLPIYSKLDIHFFHEDELLGTAGGVKNALPLFGKDPFFVVNSDAMYIDDDKNNPSFFQLEQNWDPEIMNILILLSAKTRSFGYNGKGDFDLNDKKQLALNKEGGKFIHAGLKIIDYRSFLPYPEKILQFYPTIYLDSLSKGKLYGQVYQGDWLHIGDLKAYQKYHQK
jgi:MurNAc alpha-1-phosphate uridylyltransferase